MESKTVYKVFIQSCKQCLALQKYIHKSSMLSREHPEVNMFIVKPSKETADRGISEVLPLSRASSLGEWGFSTPSQLGIQSLKSSSDDTLFLTLTVKNNLDSLQPAFQEISRTLFKHKQQAMELILLPYLHIDSLFFIALIPGCTLF